MKETKPTYTPIVEVDSSIVDFKLPLPEWVKREEIGVNVHAMEVLCRLAAVKSLLVGAFDEKEEISSIVSGLNGDGTATAAGVSFVQSSNRTDSKRDVLNPDSLLVPSQCSARYLWAEATLDLNMLNIQKQVGERGSLRSTEAWCYVLNKETKNGMSRLAKENLLAPTHRDRLLWTISLAFSSGAILIPASMGEYTTSIEAILAYGGFVGILPSSIAFLEALLIGYLPRATLAPFGFEVDRYAVTHGYLATQRLLAPVR